MSTSTNIDNDRSIKSETALMRMLATPNTDAPNAVPSPSPTPTAAFFFTLTLHAYF